MASRWFGAPSLLPLVASATRSVRTGGGVKTARDASGCNNGLARGVVLDGGESGDWLLVRTCRAGAGGDATSSSSPLGAPPSSSSAALDLTTTPAWALRRARSGSGALLRELLLEVGRCLEKD